MPKALALFLLFVAIAVISMCVAYIVHALVPNNVGVNLFLCAVIGFFLGYFVYAPAIKNILDGK